VASRLGFVRRRQTGSHVLLRDARVEALINAPVKDGRSPVALAAQAEFRQARPGHPEPDYRGVLDRLLRQGGDVDSRDSNGATPLHQAAGKGHRDLAEDLLSHGASVRARDLSGWTPLHWAASRGRSATVSLLVARGANVNATTDRGETALGLARAGGHQDVVLLLDAEGHGRGTTRADWKEADQECWRQSGSGTGSSLVPLGPILEFGSEAKWRQAPYDDCMRRRGFPATR
jgi:ankyrin repeat protein